MMIVMVIVVVAWRESTCTRAREIAHAKGGRRERERGRERERKGEREKERERQTARERKKNIYIYKRET